VYCSRVVPAFRAPGVRSIAILACNSFFSLEILCFCAADNKSWMEDSSHSHLIHINYCNSTIHHSFPLSPYHKMLLLFRSKKADDDMYSTLPDAISLSDSLFPVPGQRGRQKNEMSALWLNRQIEQRPVATSSISNSNEYALLRKENQRLRLRLSTAEERIKVLETLCKQNHIDIPIHVTKRNKDSASVSSIASTVVVGSSSTPKINNLSKSETARVKAKDVMKRSKSFSHDKTPPCTPPRIDDHSKDVKVRFLLDEDKKGQNGNNLSKSRSWGQPKPFQSSDDMLECDIRYGIPKISRITDSSTFDIEPDGNSFPFRACMQSFVSSKNRAERGRTLSISSYDDVYSPSKVHNRSVEMGARSILKNSSYQGRNESFRNLSTSRLDRAEI
jgi:hypothetical protein